MLISLINYPWTIEDTRNNFKNCKLIFYCTKSKSNQLSLTNRCDNIKNSCFNGSARAINDHKNYTDPHIIPMDNNKLSFKYTKREKQTKLEWSFSINFTFQLRYTTQ